MRILNQLKIFAVILHILVIVKCENGEPFCRLGYGLSSWGVNSNGSYRCFNFRIFPANLSNPGEINALDFGIQNNNFPILKTGMLITSKTTNLKVLDLNNCEIKSIEKGAFRGGTKLTRLYLSNNEFENLDLIVFRDVPNLEGLWLHKNPIENILGEELQLKELTLLTLDHCKLRSINPSWFKDLKSLNRVYLEGNQLTTIDWKVFRPLQNIRVSLHNNPFHCDCQLKFLLDYFDKKKIVWYDNTEKPACKSFDTTAPASNGINLTMINRHKLFCPPQVASLQTRKNLQDIIFLECEYSGYPEPTVTWKIDEKPLKIGVGNKHLIETTIPEESDEPEFNYRFKQTLLTFLLPIASNDTKVQFTCEASNSFFNSSESNSVYLKLVNMEDSTPMVTTELFNTELIKTELNSMVTVITSVVAFLSGVAIVSGIVLIRHLHKTPKMPKEIYKFLPYYSSRREATINNSDTMQPQLESNPEVDRTSDCLNSSWDDDEEYEHIYEIPLSVTQSYYNGNAS